MKKTRRNFKQLMSWFAIASIVALLVSCSAAPEDAIVGKWKWTNGSETMEFFKDGKVRVYATGGMDVSGTYKFIEKDRVSMSLSGMTTRVSGVSISGDELTLTAGDNSVLKYRRAK